VYHCSVDATQTSSPIAARPEALDPAPAADDDPPLLRARSPRIQANAALNRAERREGALALKSKPQVVFVELSRRCNLACPMCDRWKLPKTSFVDMDGELIEWLMDGLFPTAAIVDLHGLGESTLHPRFCEVVRRATALGSRVRLVTNLNGLSQEVMETLVETDSYVCFSLGALRQSEYVRIYARGQFQDLSANLRLLQGLRRQNGACRDMTCLSMIYQPNIRHVVDLLHFLADHDVRNHRIFPMYLKANDRRFVGLHLDEWRAMVDQAFDVADRLGMELRVVDWPVAPEHSTKTLAAHTCHRPWTHIHINVDGQVGLCDYNEHAEVLASLRVGGGGFDAIWNGPVYRSLRSNFRDGFPSKSSTFCGEVCRQTKYVDFDDLILPELSRRVLSNRNRGL
jgi:MoaA/NifB/PqqE/SkfB family radical SAM enzyme